jgi:hypothetical protein
LADLEKRALLLGALRLLKRGCPGSRRRPKDRRFACRHSDVAERKRQPRAGAVAATIRIKPQPNLSSATAHPEQVEAPEGNDDQGARGQSQQHDNCFQHRLTPLVSQKHALLPRNCHHSVPGNIRMKPFSAADENVLKQTAV